MQLERVPGSFIPNTPDFQMNIIKTILAIVAAASPATLLCQTADTQLLVEVRSVEGDFLEGQPLEVVQTDYDVSYGELRLAADGTVRLSVYPGNHRVTLRRPGFETASTDFNVPAEQGFFKVELQLAEKTRDPYALTVQTIHEPITGTDRLELGWNVEPPVFFDDFDSHEPFATSFGQWTGIDGDGEATASLLGSYPNRGVMQYCQIINPLAVTPTWWYDYPILRPYSGNQYAGFIRTASGNPNDDWLISPVVTPGEENELAFMAKAADKFAERFMVYVTETPDDPRPEDFTRIDTGNYEAADYKGWRRFSYDLSPWAGKPIRFAIRYVADTNRYGAFMLMVDDVYVGPVQADSPMPLDMAKRVSRRSPANPNETFEVYLDGELQGTTEGYSLTIPAIAPGPHTAAVEAVYRATRSNRVEREFEVAADGYCRLDLSFTANSLLEADRVAFTLTETTLGTTWDLQAEDGAFTLLSLPKGRYCVHVGEGAYRAMDREFDLNEDLALALELEDNIIEPFNLTATPGEEGWTLKWNQESLFTESFEEFDDFSTGEFGGWKSVDRDQAPVYPIALGDQSNLVSFPGSGNATNPTAIPPMVFNPWTTQPPMMPSDPAIAAPDGDKTVVFFSPQRYRADKWLISPQLDIRDDYQFSILAKGYSIYPEAIELCMSDGSDNPTDFQVLAEVPELTYHSWSKYIVSLEGFAGTGKRLAVHYVSTDAFLAQVDCFTVGPDEENRQAVDYGNILRFDIYLDGEKVAETTGTQFTLQLPDPGIHTLGIRAIYLNGESTMAEMTIGSDGVERVGNAEIVPGATFDLLGRPSTREAAGVQVRPDGVKTLKTNSK